jgi:hypothetical protein
MRGYATTDVPAHSEGGTVMGESHTPADDVVFDLISIQYHALKGAQVYARYLEDAEGHDDVRQFIEQVRQEDSQRAVRAHELIGKLTKTGGLGHAEAART